MLMGKKEPQHRDGIGAKFQQGGTV